MKQFILITVLAMYSFSTLHSQDASVSALVLDEKGAPVPFASVYNSNTRRGVITNEEGRFQLDAQPTDVIVIRYLGYEEHKNSAEQLQKEGIIRLKEQIFSLDEVVVTPNTIDPVSIVKKFRFRIPTNYPRKAAQINGVYKAYSLIENEYATFFQCDVDILVKSLGSVRRPDFKTKVYGYKSFRHSDDSVRRWNINSESAFSLFCPYMYHFLGEYKKNHYQHDGFTTYSDSRLIRISFSPKQIDKSVKQYAGTMYIDPKSFAMVYLHYEMLPNELDFQRSKHGHWQKTTKMETKIMFEPHNGLYYPAYVISKLTGQVDASGKNNHQEAVNVDIVYNFFTKNVEYNPKVFIADDFSIDQLRSNSTLDRSDYKSNLVLETEKEKQFFNSLK